MSRARLGVLLSQEFGDVGVDLVDLLLLDHPLAEQLLLVHCVGVLMLLDFLQAQTA